MPDNSNGGLLPKPVRIFAWIYTGVVVLSALYLVLANPGNAFGGGQPIVFGWFQTYPGQSTALQLLGTFIAAVGAVAHLIDIRLRQSGSAPLGVLIAAVAGPLLIVAGQAIQGAQDNPLVLLVLGVMSAFITLIWILAGVFVGIKRAYSWIKSRIKPGG